jgi:uncharacterized protein with ACT and thioredoxin-like domain
MQIRKKGGWNLKKIFSSETTIKISSPLFSIFSLAAILVGSRDQRTQFRKGAIQESIQQNFVDIGPVVSEEKIFLKFHPPPFF